MCWKTFVTITWSKATLISHVFKACCWVFRKKWDGWPLCNLFLRDFLFFLLKKALLPSDLILILRDPFYGLGRTLYSFWKVLFLCTCVIVSLEKSYFLNSHLDLRISLRWWEELEDRGTDLLPNYLPAQPWIPPHLTLDVAGVSQDLQGWAEPVNDRKNIPWRTHLAREVSNSKPHTGGQAKDRVFQWLWLALIIILIFSSHGWILNRFPS